MSAVWNAPQQRRYERVPFHCRATISLPPAPGSVAAHSIDISRGGVGLVTFASPKAGSAVSIAFVLNVQGRERIERVVGRVVALRADVEGNRPLDRLKTPLLMAKVVEE
jgi:hypothetical protein